MTKVIRVNDKIHKKIKREANEQDMTIQAYVEDQLS